MQAALGLYALGDGNDARLRAMDQVDFDTCSPLELLQYAQHMACLCRDLSAQKPSRVAAPLRFRFRSTLTNSYWLHMAWISYKLGAVMQLFVANQCKFDAMLHCRYVHSHDLDPESLSNALVEHLMQAIGLLSWMLNEGGKSSLFVNDMASDEYFKMEQSYHALRVWTLWIVAGREQHSLDPGEFDLEKRQLICRLYKTASEIAFSHNLLKFESMQCINKDCVRQVMVNKGDFWAFDKGDIGQAIPCYQEAIKMDWPCSSRAEQVIRINAMHVHSRLVPVSMLQDIEPHAAPNHALLTLGKSPFVVCPDLKFTFNLSVPRGAT
jgi:hypothetical protein